jgi:hypothetical protein
MQKEVLRHRKKYPEYINLNKKFLDKRMMIDFSLSLKKDPGWKCSTEACPWNQGKDSGYVKGL